MVRREMPFELWTKCQDTRKCVVGCLQRRLRRNEKGIEIQTEELVHPRPSRALPRTRCEFCKLDKISEGLQVGLQSSPIDRSELQVSLLRELYSESFIFGCSENKTKDKQKDHSYRKELRNMVRYPHTKRLEPAAANFVTKKHFH